MNTRAICPFQPQNKADYLDLLRETVTWPGVREVQLNDEGMLDLYFQVGCYCDYCRGQFELLTGSPPPEALIDPDDQLWWRWMEFRMDSWTALHTELRAELKKLRPDVQVGIQHSVKWAGFAENPWRGGISLARDAQTLDMLATNPYPFRNFNVMPYRPHRRILTEGSRALAGVCLDTHFNMLPQAYMPSIKTTPMGRQDGLLAGLIPFAMGADTVTPYNYELMKIIPGFTEGFVDTLRLQPYFESGKPYFFSTAIQPHQSEVRGHPESKWGNSCLTQFSDVMFHTGMGWRWFWDQRLEDAADQLHGPLVMPDVHCLTEQQLDAVQQVARRGEGVLWIRQHAPRTLVWARRLSTTEPVRAG